jgi:hypothetical protein
LDLFYREPPTDNLLYFVFEFSPAKHCESKVNYETGGNWWISQHSLHRLVCIPDITMGKI